MADNFPLTPGAGRNAATDQVTHSGDTADVQLFRRVHVKGSEGTKTVVDIPAYVIQEDIFSATGDGTVINCEDYPLKHWTLVIGEVGGVATSWTASVLGSVDGSQWVTVMTMTRATHGAPGIMGNPAPLALRYAMVSVTALNLGTATAITADLMGTP